MTAGSGRANEQRGLLAERIKQARERLRLTQEELANRAGLTYKQSVSTIEKGERDVKAVELVRIAEALHLSVVDLLSAPPEEPSILWRKAPGDEKERVEIEARLFQRCRQYRLAESWVGVSRTSALPDIAVPQKVNECLQADRLPAEVYVYTENLANDMHRLLDLGGFPSSALIRALEESAGVMVLYEKDLEGSAACLRDGLDALIVLNSSEVPWRRNYSLAHDLFHVLTWESLPPEYFKDDPIRLKYVERMADAFASALLLPEESLRPRLAERLRNGKLSDPQIADLAELARQFDVSIDALIWRLVNLQWLDKKKAERLLSDRGAIWLDRSISWPEEARELPDRFMQLLLIAYLRGNVSAGRIAELTGQSLVEVRRRLAMIGEGEKAVQDKPPAA